MPHSCCAAAWKWPNSRFELRSGGQAGGLSYLQAGDLDPGAFVPALDAFFGELHTLGAFQQAPAERLVFDHVAEEEFPLALEGVVEGILLRDLLPAFEIVERAFHIGVPDGSRGVAVVDRKSTRLNSSHLG